MTVKFISDLHLSADRPDITGLFVHFLRHEARFAEALYILGDLFEYWIGDDDNTTFHQTIKSELKALTDAGVPCFFIHGNRDFLIGHQFATETGITLLSESCVIDLYGVPTAILHGDTLCTDDRKYQRFRKIIRQPWLLKVACMLPLALRRKVAHFLRDHSTGNAQGLDNASKPTEADLAKYDATATAIHALFLDTQASRIIHGHTHRPHVHQHHEGERIVLGDWYEQGSILDVDDSGAHLRCEPLHRQ